MGDYRVREAQIGTDFHSDTVGGKEVPQQRDAPFSTGARATQTVTTAGTPVQLPSSATCRVLFMRALPSNTGRVAWAFDNGVRAGAGLNADYMEPGEGRVIPISNPSLIWIDAQISGEGVAMTILTHGDS